MTYAAKTDVSVERSKRDIEKLLIRYDASKFFSGWDARAATVGFSMRDRYVQFRLPLPEREQFRTTATGAATGARRWSEEAVDRAFEQAQRARWRALLLVVKAKLESVEAGIETFEQAFLAHIMVADGHGGTTTIGDALIPQIDGAYEQGTPMLALPRGDE